MLYVERAKKSSKGSRWAVVRQPKDDRPLGFYPTRQEAEWYAAAFAQLPIDWQEETDALLAKIRDSGLLDVCIAYQASAYDFSIPLTRR